MGGPVALLLSKEFRINIISVESADSNRKFCFIEFVDRIMDT